MHLQPSPLTVDSGQHCAMYEFPEIPTPFYLVDLALLRRNLELLSHVSQAAGCRVLLALKSFAMWSLFPMMRSRLDGACASSINEARLAAEFGGEIHIFSPAYRGEEIDDLLALVDHMVFNTPSQWRRFRDRVKAAGVSPGLRINPGYSEVKTSIYNPCRPGSRLGTRPVDLGKDDLDGIEGLHFHALCGQDSFTLERVLARFEEGVSGIIPRMRWVNFGGGHHITRDDYDIGHLIGLIRDFRHRYPGVEVYLEPGEAVALNSGFLVATVLEVMESEGGRIAILDTSATTHMPDVLEMPYRPEIIGAGRPGEKGHVYQLAGPSCLAGDIIGDYSFDSPLVPGRRLVFTDMAHYTMVKNNTFNGINLPAIVTFDPDTGSTTVVRYLWLRGFPHPSFLSGCRTRIHHFHHHAG